jgi:hypothetical protein
VIKGLIGEDLLHFASAIAHTGTVKRATRKGDDEARLARLERAGIIRRGHKAKVQEVLKEPPPSPRKGGDILKALLDEREEGC